MITVILPTIQHDWFQNDGLYKCMEYSFEMLLFCISMQLLRFGYVNGFLNSVKEIIWQMEAIYCFPLMLTFAICMC